MSKQEPMLMESPLTKRVFVVTSYKDEGHGVFTARKKHDVTEQFDALAAARRGECENLIDPWSVHESFEDDFECSACHASGHANGNIDHGEFLYCPRCGAKVREVVER